MLTFTRRADSSQDAPGKARVALRAADGVRVAAEFRPGKGRRPAFILLHGLGAGKGEWGRFAGQLASRGFPSLALDARGHGDSGGSPYTTFRGPEDWEKILLDLDAAAAFLRERGVARKDVAVAGASIGANLAMLWAQTRKAPCALLFSPGMDYQGVRVQGELARFEGPLLIAAAPDDPYAWRSCESLSGSLRHAGSLFARAGAGHGAGMFEGEANGAFVRGVLDWIEKTARSPGAARR